MHRKSVINYYYLKFHILKTIPRFTTTSMKVQKILFSQNTTQQYHFFLFFYLLCNMFLVALILFPDNKHIRL